MKFDHVVKYKGEYYPVGTEVPMLEEKTGDLVDEVPKRALNDNLDGSVNEYGENEDKLRTIDTETMNDIKEQVSKLENSKNMEKTKK